MIVPIAFGVFGLITGSFLNVLILRWGARPLTGRSTCASCGSVIAWYDLIPVFSWIALRGSCRQCGAWILAQYPLVELVTAIFFVLIGFSPLPLYLRLFALPLAALLIAIAVYDFRHTLIPDVWVYACVAVTLVASLTAIPLEGLPFRLVPVLLSGPVVAAPLFALWLISGGKWMGLGDVKFAFVMGWLLGVSRGFLALLFAFILGAVVSIPLLFLSSRWWKECVNVLALAVQANARSRAQENVSPRNAPVRQSTFLLEKMMPKLVFGFTMKSEVPFGPFLVASTCILWILSMYGVDLQLLSLSEVLP